MSDKFNDYIHQLIVEKSFEYVIKNYQSIRDEYYKNKSEE